ncbi:hypothetical protein [Roseobacter sp. HKCC-CH-9208]|uniref:hypothetical protein n=1 Tax=Roseobacter sp. HKCC-CH-9208 TaxID=3120339 RepID=UPI0030ED4661
MKKISVLDCTLRDGGHVNNFLFGSDEIKEICCRLSDGLIDIIEVGFLKGNSYSIGTTLFPDIQTVEDILKDLEVKSKIALMVRPDWYDASVISYSSSVDILRFAFRKQDIDETIRQATKVKSLGYSVYLNPVNILQYSDDEFSEILKRIKVIEPDGINIVDTFGGLNLEHLRRKFDVLNQNLNKSCAVGVHLHENLSLALSLALEFISFDSAFDNLLVDSSLWGMGRSPGNLPTELLAGYLNTHGVSDYKINELNRALQWPMRAYKEKYSWGYDPGYVTSALLKVHRSYPEYFIVERGEPYPICYSCIQKIYEEGVGATFDPVVADRILSEIKNERC